MASNLIEATRDYYEKRMVRQTSYKTPMWHMLHKYKRVKKGGLRVGEKLDVADWESIVQEFASSEGITGGSKEFIDEAMWTISNQQIPLEYTFNEKTMNLPKTDAQLVNLGATYADKAAEGLRNQTTKRFMGCTGDTEHNTYETLCQGIGSALQYKAATSVVYGNITRSSTLKTYWNPADASNTYTQYNLSKEQLREWIDSCQYYAQDGDKFAVIMGQNLFRGLVGEFEGYVQYTQSSFRSKQGFNAIQLDEDDVEIIEDPLLDTLTCSSVTNKAGEDACLLGQYQTDNYASITEPGKHVVIILNLRTWALRWVDSPLEGVNKDGMTRFTDFFQQALVEGKPIKWLGHAYTHLNLCCNQPASNMWRANVH